MKKQIRRLSPHQNAKVIAVLLAISIIPIFIPIAIIMSFTMPEFDQYGNPVSFSTMAFWLMPIFYLVFGYISIALGCLIYNFLFKFVGGIEVEMIDKGSA